MADEDRLSTGQQKIAGYRDLTEREIHIINMIKHHGVVIGNLVAEIEELPGVDRRWAAIAKTDLQKGFMALTRAVAKPEGF